MSQSGCSIVPSSRRCCIFRSLCALLLPRSSPSLSCVRALHSFSVEPVIPQLSPAPFFPVIFLKSDLPRPHSQPPSTNKPAFQGKIQSQHTTCFKKIFLAHNVLNRTLEPFSSLKSLDEAVRFLNSSPCALFQTASTSFNKQSQ